jgi:hypothetical protein
MKLFDKMSPANQAAIKEFGLKYPYSGGDVVKELKRKESWLDLSYSSITQLCSVLKSKDYSPIFIDDLFSGK